MQRKTPLVQGETYHIYNRGAHKQKVFTCESDYNRLLLLLFLSNQSRPVNLRDLLATNKYKGRSFGSVFEEERGEGLVEVLAYCLMPNHFHLVLRQKAENGISIFMKKLLTAYSMYFNTKYEHSGVLFQGRFKSSHIENEAYFRYIFAYVHLNPLDLFDSGWKKGEMQDIGGSRKFIQEYAFSSFIDYINVDRPQRAILSLDTMPDFLKEQNDLEDLLRSFPKGPSFGEGLGLIIRP